MKYKHKIEWKESAQLDIVTINRFYGLKNAKLNILLTIIFSSLMLFAPYLYLFSFFINAIKTKQPMIILPNTFINVLLIILLCISLIGFIIIIVFSIIGLIKGKRGIKYFINTTKTMKLSIISLVVTTINFLILLIYFISYLIIII